MKHDPTTQKLSNQSSPILSGEPALKPLTLDPEKYRHHLGEYDLSEAQKTELLETLWSIMSTMVDIGFSLDSVQLASLLTSENSGADSENKVEENNAHTFKQAAINHVAREESDE